MYVYHIYGIYYISTLPVETQYSIPYRRYSVPWDNSSNCGSCFLNWKLSFMM